MKPDGRELHVSEVIRSAAYATGRPVGMLYLFGKLEFEGVASFGLPIRIPNVPAADSFLTAGRLCLEDVFVVNKLASETVTNDVNNELFFTKLLPELQSAAMAPIFCGSSRACGLLILADTSATRPFSARELYLLRSHADQASVLLELSMLRSSLSDNSTHSEKLNRSMSSTTGTAPAALTFTSESYILDAEIEYLQRIRAQLSYSAFHDNLTLLYNRQFFMDRLVSAYEKFTEESGSKFAILLLDLDRFKVVNDSLGHRAGDLLLIEVARRLSACTRPSDVLARIGGDEFALLVEVSEYPNSTEVLAQRLIQAISCSTFNLSGQEVVPSCSIGIARVTRQHRVPEDILHDADLAMYHAKRQNSGYSTFSYAMGNEATKKMQMRSDLARALTRKEFFLEYQPIYRVATMELVALEILVCWQHPRLGILLPDAFKKDAEEFSFIGRIGSWALHEACARKAEWKAKFLESTIRMSLNVFGEQFRGGALATEVKEVLLSSGLAPNELQLQVAESVLAKNSTLATDALVELRSLGVEVVLNEFGTGVSSLSDLDQYPIDVVKIDRSFTSQMQNKPMSETLIKAIINFGSALGLEVAAEGVDNESQFRTLISSSCKYVQGFFFSPPVSAGQITRMLRSRSHSSSIGS